MLAALTASAHGFSSTPKTPSGCPEDLFGYVDPYTMAVVDSSVDPLVLADNFGFGPAGGDFLYTATKAAVLHYLPFRSDVPNALPRPSPRPSALPRASRAMAPACALVRRDAASTSRPPTKRAARFSARTRI